jgi:hypothetical protein
MLSLATSAYMKHISRNLFIVLQIAFLLVVLVVTITTIQEEYKWYRPVAELDGEKGFVISASGYHGESAEQLTQNMQKIKSVMSWEYGNFSIPEKDEYAISFAYPDELLTSYSPELQSGKWLDESDQSEDGIDIVISNNPYGWKEGSRIELLYYDENEQPHRIQAYVSGVIREGAGIIGSGVGSSQVVHSDYRDLYSVYSYEQDESILILMSEKQACSRKITMTYNQMHFVTYEDDITDSEIAINESHLKQNLGVGAEGTSIFCNLTEFMFNSTHEMQRNVLVYLPVFVCVLLVTLISLINVCTLNLAEDIRQNAVFCILGLPWKKNSLLTVIQSVITAVMSAGLAVFFLLLIQRTALSTYIYAKISGITVLAVVLILFILCLIHYLCAAWILKKNKPAELLRNAI